MSNYNLCKKFIQWDNISKESFTNYVNITEEEWCDFWYFMKQKYETFWGTSHCQKYISECNREYIRSKL